MTSFDIYTVKESDSTLPKKVSKITFEFFQQSLFHLHSDTSVKYNH